MGIKLNSGRITKSHAVGSEIWDHADSVEVIQIDKI